MDLTKEILEILNSDAKEFENAKVLALFADCFEDKAKELNDLFALHIVGITLKEKYKTDIEMKIKDIKFSTDNYETSLHKKMLIGDYKNDRFIANFRDHSIITPISIWWAKKQITLRFIALNN